MAMTNGGSGRVTTAPAPTTVPYPTSAMLHLPHTAALETLSSHGLPFRCRKRCFPIRLGSYHLPLLADTYPLTAFDEAMQASLSGGVLKNILIPV